ncbi:MAG: DUF480 domain-containing protein [Steroidobacteraceae bacterium]
MNIRLTPLEARITGALIEKQISTPDQYPLSLNALLNACNQKSNREPVMNLDEPALQQAVDGLMKKHFVLEKSGFGSRVPKYQHRFCNTEHGSLKFSPAELAIVCELLLRGAQTPGELRGRAARLAPFQDVSEVECALQGLMQRADWPFVERLAREPGRRESRYAQLFCADETIAAASQPQAGTASDPPDQAPDQVERLDRLEGEVRRLAAEVAQLRSRFDVR